MGVYYLRLPPPWKPPPKLEAPREPLANAL
jgi:hypothetical protein